MRQQPAAAAATTRRRKPIASPSRADVFDERNVLGRLATVGSLGKSGGGADDPGDGFLPARDEFNDTLALGLDGGWWELDRGVPVLSPFLRFSWFLLI
jgi:hypothetical protein